jgi:hypothetical protein
MVGTPQYLSQAANMTHSDKEEFFVETLACSTKLTQNPSLLNLLKLKVNPSADVRQTVKHITYVNGEEVVKFLTDIFDAVFAVLDRYDHMYLRSHGVQPSRPFARGI